MSLMDIINKRKQSFATAPVSAEALATRQVEATGKAATPQTGPQMTNIQARLAAQAGQTAQQQQQLGQQTQLAGMAQQEQAQQAQFEQAQAAQEARTQQTTQDLLAREQMADATRQQQEDAALAEMQTQEQLRMRDLSETYANALNKLAVDNRIAEQEIFQYAREKRAELGADKHRAFLDQVSHSAALSDKKYMAEIDRIGRERRLVDEIEFKKEAQRIAFGNDFNALAQQFNMQSLLNADYRQYKQQVAEMDLQTALSMAETAHKESQYKSILQGTVAMAPAIAGMFSSTTADTKPIDWSTTTETTAPAVGATSTPKGGYNQSPVNWWEQGK